MGRKRMFMDITPLKESPDFRRLWIGNGLSTFGGYMTSYAVILQIYNMTHSSIAVGTAGLCIAIPSALFVLISGTIGDSMDRRKLVLLGTSGQMVVSFLFAAQAVLNLDQLWLLYSLLIIQTLLGSLNAPARKTFMPRLLPKEQIRAGATLNMSFMTFSGVAGPVVAGFLTSLWSLNICYIIDFLSYIAAFYGVIRLPAMHPKSSSASKPNLKSVGEGIRFIFNNRLVAGAFLTDMSITVLGATTALFPAITKNYYEGDPQILGLLMGAPAAGGLIGTLLSGPLKNITREGRAILICSLIWAGAIVGFGLSLGISLWITILFLLIAGATDTTIVILNTTIVQVNTPDRYRARVNAVEHLLGFGGPQLGDFRAGMVGTFFTPTFSIVIGGFSAAIGATLVSILIPNFRNYSLRESEKNNKHSLKLN